jgi:hypothetical protein
LEKDLKKSIRRAKRKQERDLFKNDDRNGKKFTQYIKSKTKTRSEIGPLKKSDGTITDNKCFYWRRFDICANQGVRNKYVIDRHHCHPAKSGN